jgi:prophage maintenance system killer protein
VTLLGQDAYPQLWTKAAALLQSVVNNHALIDGNKRLGWLATAVLLEINAASVVGARNDDVYELVLTSQPTARRSNRSPPNTTIRDQAQATATGEPDS